jgi:hypothetical protein
MMLFEATKGLQKPVLSIEKSINKLLLKAVLTGKQFEALKPEKMQLENMTCGKGLLAPVDSKLSKKMQ